MTHKQTKILLKIVLGLSLIFIIYCFVLFMLQNNNKNEYKPNNEKYERFLLRSIDNNVYSVEISAEGNISNIQKTDINLNFMREIDKKSLTEGIYVNTKAELLGLIEDFSS